MSAELIKEFKTKIKKSIESNYHIDEALKIINQLPDELKDMPGRRWIFVQCVGNDTEINMKFLLFILV